MTHWCAQYIGQPWTEEMDCLGWFRFWSAIHFGVFVPGAALDHSRLTQSAVRTMRADIEGSFGFRQTAAPVEGDAVFLTQRRRPHHVGMVVVVDRRRQVLHAMENSGVMLMDGADLHLGGWRTAGFWTPIKE